MPRTKFGPLVSDSLYDIGTEVVNINSLMLFPCSRSVPEVCPGASPFPLNSVVYAGFLVR